MMSSQQPRPKTDADLKKEFLSICKERGLEYGIIIRKMNNPYFQAQWREDFGMMFFGPTAAKPFVTNPLLVYKVFPDGKEELVRGAEISGMSAQTFKEILSASENDYVYNHLTLPRRSTLSGFFGGDTRVAVVTPSLLFESIDLKKCSAGYTTALVASHPVFGK